MPLEVLTTPATGQKGVTHGGRERKRETDTETEREIRRRGKRRGGEREREGEAEIHTIQDTLGLRGPFQI